MSEWDEFPERIRRRRKHFPFYDNWFRNIDEMMEEIFKDMQKSIPNNLIKEEKLPDGSKVRRVGPVIYGYSVSLGPDGKPIIREFGNVKPSMKSEAFGGRRPGLEVKAEREPLVDTIEEDETIKVVAEVPGVEKDDIDLDCTEKTLTISVDSATKKYYKDIEFPSDVDPTSAQASYRNGVLEVTLNKTKPKTKGRRIEIK